MPNPYEPRPHPGRWRESRARVRRKWTTVFHYVEWLTRLAAYYLSHWSLLEVLEYLGRFTVLVAVIVYFSEVPDRRKQKHYQAWQVINSAAGKSGNGGRVEALQELNEDHISLVAVDLSNAFLQGLKLPGADLHFATMRGCDLRNCDLRRANLTGTVLNGSNLRGADLRNIQAAGVEAYECDLTGAQLAGADLSWADLRNADFGEVNWNGITTIGGANLHGIEHAPPGLMEWAMRHGAVDIASDDAWAKARSTRPASTQP